MPRAKGDTDRTARINQRVKDFVDITFDGNLSAAARAVGCRYDPLRLLYLGIARRPAVDVLNAIARFDQGTERGYYLGD